MPTEEKDDPQLPRMGTRRRIKRLEERQAEQAEAIRSLEQQHAVLMNDVRWILKTTLGASAVIATLLSLAAQALGPLV